MYATLISYKKKLRYVSSKSYQRSSDVCLQCKILAKSDGFINIYISEKWYSFACRSSRASLALPELRSELCLQHSDGNDSANAQGAYTVQ